MNGTESPDGLSPIPAFKYHVIPIIFISPTRHILYRTQAWQTASNHSITFLCQLRSKSKLLKCALEAEPNNLLPDNRLQQRELPIGSTYEPRRAPWSLTCLNRHLRGIVQHEILGLPRHRLLFRNYHDADKYIAWVRMLGDGSCALIKHLVLDFDLNIVTTTWMRGSQSSVRTSVLLAIFTLHSPSCGRRTIYLPIPGYEDMASIPPHLRTQLAYRDAYIY